MNIIIKWPFQATRMLAWRFSTIRHDFANVHMTIGKRHQWPTRVWRYTSYYVYVHELPAFQTCLVDVSAWLFILQNGDRLAAASALLRINPNSLRSKLTWHCWISTTMYTVQSFRRRFMLHCGFTVRMLLSPATQNIRQLDAVSYRFEIGSVTTHRVKQEINSSRRGIVQWHCMK